MGLPSSGDSYPVNKPMIGHQIKINVMKAKRMGIRGKSVGILVCFSWDGHGGPPGGGDV